MADDHESSPSRATTQGGGFHLTRRQLLVGGGTTAAAVWAAEAVGVNPLSRLISGVVRPQVVTAVLRRREDFVDLSFVFSNARIDRTDPAHPTIVKAVDTAALTAVATFQPQHVLEQAFFETDSPATTEAPTEPAKTRLSGSSRLAWAIPDSALPIPYTAAGILDWSRWLLRVVPAASGPFISYSTLVAPSSQQTMIEYPWRLVLSPGYNETWVNPLAPVTLNGRTDLWTTSLHGPTRIIGDLGPTGDAPNRNLPVFEVLRDPAYVRAVWTINEKHSANTKDSLKVPDDDTVPFAHNALTENDRWSIVQNTSVWRHTTFGPNPDPGYEALPVKLKHLRLSTLGGFMDGHGHWDNGFRTSLIDWRQVGTLGRDHYVRTVKKGFLFPFGIPAVDVRITERKFQNHPGTNRKFAYLRKRHFLVMSQDDKLFGGDAFAQRYAGRKLPFVALRCETRVTPNLDPKEPANDEPRVLEDNPDFGYIPKVGDVPFRFHFVGTDWRQDEIEFTTACVFVDFEAGFNAGAMEELRGNWNALEDGDYDGIRLSQLHNARITMAPSEDDGDTAQTVSSIRWGAQSLVTSDDDYTKAELINKNQPRFHPSLTNATIRLSAAEAVKGSAVSGGGVDVGYHAPFLGAATDGAGGGFDPVLNSGEVFLELVDDTPLDFGGDKCGGVMVPNVKIRALSRKIGPVGGDLATARGGTFDASSFFDGADATLLGVIDIADIVEPNLPIGSAPTITSRRSGDEVTTYLHFAPAPQTDPDHYFAPSSATTMVIDAVIVSSISDPSRSKVTIDGNITDFTLQMLGDGATDFIDLHFTQLQFHAETGHATSINPVIDNVEFKGVLEFINDLKDYLGIGDDAPAIDVTSAGITAHTGVDIPSIGIGVFTLENLSFGGSLILPFNGDPAQIEFNFCTREAPFHVAVMIFSGGGWFAISIDLSGVKTLEIGLEFGASMCIDLGVAKGEVHIYAGIYFMLDTNDDGDTNAYIEGYVRAGGSVEVMVIASVSLEAYLAFSYDGATDKVGGEAELTLTVSVLCFSASVSAHFEQYFGGEGDPSLKDAMPSNETLGVSSGDADYDKTHSIYWNEYCNAFAPARLPS